MPALRTIAAILYWAEYFLARNFGYSMPNRWAGLRNGKAHEPGDFDCTSIIGAILYLAGYVPLSALMGTWYSGNLAAVLPKYGFRKVSAKGKSLAWLKKNVTAGAVLVGPHHGVLGMGGGKVLSWEWSETGGVKGKVGRQKGERVVKRDVYLRSKGWLWLLLPPADAVTVSKPKSLLFRVAQATQENPYFGGPASWSARGQEMAKLGASLIGATETTVTAKGKTAWSGRVAMQTAIGRTWKRYAYLALCIFYDGTKWARKGTARTVRFGPKSDIWHGAVVVPMLRKDSDTRVDVGEYHVRPKTVATAAQKLADVRATLALVDPNVPTVLMGDGAGNWDAEMAKHGFTRVTEKGDSYDLKGVQDIDAVYFSHHLIGSLPKDHNPGPDSDHIWRSVRGQLAGGDL